MGTPTQTQGISRIDFLFHVTDFYKRLHEKRSLTLREYRSWERAESELEELCPPETEREYQDLPL